MTRRPDAHLCRVRLGSALATLSLMLLAGCGGRGLEVESRWRDQEIVIDGIDSDWQERIAFLEEEELGFGIQNDETYLYLCLKTADRRIIGQVLGLGLTAWFDPDGGKEKSLGIRFPLGTDQPVRLREELTDSYEEEPGIPELVGDELEIIEPEHDVHVSRLVSVADGIDAAVTQSGGWFIYELQVPLTRSTNHPHAIGAAEGDAIGIGFETPERSPEMGRGMPGGQMPPPGGGRSEGGGRPPGGPGGPPPGAGGRPERLGLWMTVTLASSESAVTE